MFSTSVAENSDCDKAKPARAKREQGPSRWAVAVHFHHSGTLPVFVGDSSRLPLPFSVVSLSAGGGGLAVN